jgi:hypothetical protein
MISNIYATDLDDWPAVLRALRLTGEEFRGGKIATIPPPNTSSRASAEAVKGVSAQ